MRLRYTLNNPIEGEHITTYSPKGWQETELILKRHEKYEGIFLDYTVKIDFFCGAGKEYVDNIYDTQGIDAELEVMIEMDCDDSGTYTLMYNGKGIMKSYEKIQAAPEYTRLNLEENGIIQTVLNRMDTKVDLTKLETLDGDSLDTLTYAPYELNLHSKELFLTGQFINDTLRGTFNTVTEGLSNFHVIPLDIQTNEIEEMLYPTSYDPGTPFFFNNINVPRTINVSGRVRVSVIQRATVGASTFLYSGGFNIVINILDGAFVSVATTTIHTEPVVSTSTAQIFDITIPDTPVTVAGLFYIQLAYQDYHMLTLGAVSVYNSDYSYQPETNLLLEESSTIDATTTNAFAVFETGADISRKITGQADSFRSNYFGRKNSEPFAYDSNGCGSFTAFTNGFQVRGFPLADKPVYMSMREYYEGLSAIHCLGLGIKQDEDDNTFIEVEPKNYFYRNNEVVLTLNNVRGLTTKLDPRYFYSRFTIGFKDWRKEGLNGLDEFCTTHNYATLLKSVNNELVAQSDFIAAPYALERQRRERYSTTTTTDEDYDNNNFIIALNRSVDGSGIPSDLDIAEKDENFTNVENVFSPSTIYNLRFSPARSARNWYKILSTSLIKLNDTLKTIRFSFAEGNKSMTSEGTDLCDPANQELISEGEDLVLEVPTVNDEYDPLFTGEIDTIEDYPLSFSSYTHLKALDSDGVPNFYKMIRYSTSESGYLFGFIEEIRYNPIIGKAKFTFRRAYNLDELCTHIYVEEGYVECGYVE